MRHFSRFCCFVLLVLLPFVSIAKTDLIVYTNIEPEDFSQYYKAFEASNPDIKIKWVRDSTGPIAARLLAEKGAPKADIAFGVALSTILLLDEQEMFESYQPINFDKVSSIMKDSRKAPVWIGVSAYASSFCVNTRELEKRKLPIPQTWQDLIKTKYKGYLIMPNPASSGTGYMSVSAWLQTMGEEKAWQYMNHLHTNIKMYTHSGCKPCQMAAQGEIPIGISTNVCAKSFIARGAPIEVIVPKDGASWEAEAVAILKSSKNKEAARRFMDFAASEAAARVAVANGYIPGRIEFANEKIKGIQKQLIDIDFIKRASQRPFVLAKWRNQFDK